MADWEKVTGIPNPAANVRGVGWSPDGTQVASGITSSPYTVNILDVASKAFIAGPGDVDGVVEDARYSPDGTMLAVVHAAGNRLSIFDTSDWSAVVGITDMSSTSPFHTLRGVAWSPSGDRLVVVGSGDTKIAVIDTSDWSIVPAAPTTLPGDGWSVAYSADATRVAVGHLSGDRLTVYDTSDWSTVAGTPTLPSEGYGVAFSVDGAYLAASYFTSPHLSIFDTSDWSEETIPEIADTGRDVHFSPDGAWLVIAHRFSPMVTILAVGTWAEEGDSFSFGNTAWSAQFSPDSTSIAVGLEDSGERLALIQQVVEPTMHITTDDTSVDMSGSTDPIAIVTVDLVDTAVDMEATHTVPAWSELGGTPNLGAVSRASVFSPDGQYLAACDDSAPKLTVLLVSDWSVIAEVPAVAGAIFTCVGFSPDSAYLAVGKSGVPDAGVEVLDTSDWSAVSGLIVEDKDVQQVRFSPDGSLLAVGSSTSPRLHIVDTSDWSVVPGTPSMPDVVRDVAFNPSGSWLAVTHHNNHPYVTILDTSDWSVVPGTPVVSSGWGFSVDFSPDGTQLAIGQASPDRLAVYNTADWSPVSLTDIPDNTVTKARFSPDGRFLACGEDGFGWVTVLDTSDWTEASDITGPGSSSVLSVDFSPDNAYLAMSSSADPYLHVLTVPPAPEEMIVVFDDTQAAMVGSALVTGDMAATIADTTASVEADFVANVAAVTITLENTAAAFVARVAHYADITLSGGASATLDTRDIQKIALQALALTDTETFYNPQEEITAQAAAQLLHIVAYVEALTLAGEAELTASVEHMIPLWLQARAGGVLETDLQRLFEDMLEALAGDSAVAAAAALISEVGDAEGSVVGTIAMEIMDDLAAELTAENVLFVSINETLEAEAGDTVEALGHYNLNVKDMAGAWLVFKVSGEVIQGWVMNLEGDRPFSEYSEFDFNSMTRIGSSYFAASDTGLHMLGGDTDGGEQIDARLSSMMLDFDTTAQKRVVAAYLGYTSDGTVVLKVRSVDDGQLVEHWYEAAEVTADAPRAGYRPLGRGLKSRYWQFELANVDGSDFEIDKLELQPIKLSRRV